MGFVQVENWQIIWVSRKMNKGKKKVLVSFRLEIFLPKWKMKRSIINTEA